MLKWRLMTSFAVKMTYACYLSWVSHDLPPLREKQTRKRIREDDFEEESRTLAAKSTLLKPLFLCIWVWRSASWAIDMSMSPLLMCAVCRKFVGTPIMLRSILSLWCGLPLFCLPAVFLVARGVRQQVKHCTQSSLSPAMLQYPSSPRRWCPRIDPTNSRKTWQWSNNLKGSDPELDKRVITGLKKKWFTSIFSSFASSF